MLEAWSFFVRRKLVARPTTQIEARMRADLYRHLQRLPIAFHDQWQSGQLLSRAVSDLSTLRRFFAFAVIFLVVNSLTLVLGLVVLFVLAPLLGLIVAVLRAAADRGVDAVRVEVQGRLPAGPGPGGRPGDHRRGVGAGHPGAEGVRPRSRTAAQVLARRRRLLRGTQLRKIHILAILWAVIIALPEIGIGLQLLVGGIGIANGTLTIGTLVAAVTVATYLRWPTDSIGWLLAETNQAASACERYWEVRGRADHRSPTRSTRSRCPPTAPATCGWRACGSRTRARPARCCAASTWTCGPARRSRWSAPRDRARRR